MKIIATIDCCLCDQEISIDIKLPDGWDVDRDLYSEVGFCPKHQNTIDWFNSQCSGCVGSWGECSFWDSIHSGYPREPLKDIDYQKIEKGICPRRTNGTMLWSPQEGLKEIDMSKKGSSELGLSLSKAIMKIRESRKHD